MACEGRRRQREKEREREREQFASSHFSLEGREREKEQKVVKEGSKSKHPFER